jgi:DNA-binding NarL/FixJ family response regulator
MQHILFFIYFFESFRPEPVHQKHFGRDQAQLNDRHTEILECIVNGFSYKLIAEKLFISLDTVRYHVNNIYEILQVHSRFELISAKRK